MSATTLTTIFDRLGRVKADTASGVSHSIVFTPATEVAGGGGVTMAILKLQFPNADNGKWCRTNGALVVSIASPDAGTTGLPGTTLSASCTKGTDGSSYDTIYICASGTGNTWSASTPYYVNITDTGVGKLGTMTAASSIKVLATTGIHATVCGDPSSPIDTGSFALATITDDQVAVTATVDPMFTFSVNNLTPGFGTFSSTTKRYATTNGSGATSDPGANNPSYVTLTTNAPNGATVSVASQYAGLYKAATPGVAHTIAATAASAVATGTESYALYVKSPSGLSAVAGFSGESSATALTTSLQTILTASAPVSSGAADIGLIAAVSGSTMAGSYTDTLTFVGTGKF